MSWASLVYTLAELGWLLVGAAGLGAFSALCLVLYHGWTLPYDMEGY